MTGWRVMRYLLVLIVGVALLAGCALVDDARREFGPEPGSEAASATRPAAPSSASPVPSASAPSVLITDPDGGCPPSGMLVSTDGFDAAMGLRVAAIMLVNCGSVPITLNGYPDVRLLDETGAPLPVTVIHGSSAVAQIDNFDTQPAPVTAAPGERLAAGLVWRGTVEAFGGAVVGTYLEVTPGPGHAAQTFLPGHRIDVGTTGRMGVTAWRPARR